MAQSKERARGARNGAPVRYGWGAVLDTDEAEIQDGMACSLVEIKQDIRIGGIVDGGLDGSVLEPMPLGEEAGRSSGGSSSLGRFRAKARCVWPRE